jgi:hypothetical protein
MFLDAVNKNESWQVMQTELLRSINELNDLAQHWCHVSTCQINTLNGHIGVMDGWLPHTETSGDQVHQVDYFSGHYLECGINVQANCDPNLLFTYIAIAGPGKINNSCAFSCLRELQNWLQNLPPW